MGIDRSDFWNVLDIDIYIYIYYTYTYILIYIYICILIYIYCWYLIEVKLWVHMIPDILRYTRHIWIEIDLPLRPGGLSQGDLEQEAQQQPNNDHHSWLLVGKKSWKTQHLEKERLVKKHRKVVVGTGTTLQVIHGFVQWNQSETHLLPICEMLVDWRCLSFQMYFKCVQDLDTRNLGEMIASIGLSNLIPSWVS